jgi:lon-related putative ATP-dependent protease
MSRDILRNIERQAFHIYSKYLEVITLVNELKPSQLRITADASSMTCETTENTVPLDTIIGQERAVKALKFGLGIQEKGFNIYVAGWPGTGRTTAVKSFLEEFARGKPLPSDWCYVNNFRNPYQPKALRLPAGSGSVFKSEMKSLIEDAQKAIQKAFESKNYQQRREAIIGGYEKKRQDLLTQLAEGARKVGFLFEITPIGPVFVPVMEGKPLTDEQFLALSPKVREDILKKRETLQSRFKDAVRDIRELEGKLSEEVSRADTEIVLYSIGPMINHLIEKYKNLYEVVSYLKEVQDDMVENRDQFLTKPDAQSSAAGIPMQLLRSISLRKYEVNVIADSSGLKGAPVVTELNPTYTSLFGRIEREAVFGALTTDFTLIIRGSLHTANGGFLVIPVEELFKNPFSWDGLKRAMKNGQIEIEDPSERYGFLTTKTISPEPIPLDMKVILIGDPSVFQVLYAYDPDFSELFKVKADFDLSMERTEENVKNYVAFICMICGREKLKHLDSSGVAKVIEYGSRLAEDQKKLSTRFASIADLVREANFYASQDKSKYVTADHVKKAMDEKVYRSNLIQEKIKEYIERNIFLIDTTGEVVGQVNGLSVINIGDYEFGRPSRVTATVGMGSAGVIDIEREVKLGGPIHSKGVLILGGYLAEKYSQDKPLTLSARLAFEQSYEGVEGDSASSTELYAILSRLANVPMKQNFAVTGSVNQLGEVQAIGGVNEKIEGFFEICKAKGLTGDQGAMIPASNVESLMLKEEVVEAVAKGKFHIYPVRTIDEGIEVLTGTKAGKRLPDGAFEPGSINDRVNKKLQEMAEKLKEFAGPEKEEKAKSEET